MNKKNAHKTPLCKRCSYGVKPGTILDRCTCPNLDKWQIIEDNPKNRETFQQVEVDAHKLGCTMQDLLEHIAPCMAVYNGQCRYFIDASSNGQ